MSEVTHVVSKKHIVNKCYNKKYIYNMAESIKTLADPHLEELSLTA